MITILFITFCFYLIAELIKQGTAAKARKREAARQARIEAEMRRDREERERVAREQREQREALLAQEKALRDMHRAQLREEKQRLKLEAEQARQAAILQKHEEAIRKLYARMEKAEDTIDHFTTLLDTLTGKRDKYQTEINQIDAVLSAKDIKAEIASKAVKGVNGWRSASGYDADADRFMEASSVSVGDTRTEKQKAADRAKLLKRKETLEGKIITLNNQIFAAEQKVKDAQNAKYDAECKIEEVS